MDQPEDNNGIEGARNGQDETPRAINPRTSFSSGNGSTSSISSYHTCNSALSRNDEGNGRRMEVMEAIAEENRKILEGKTGKKNKPFNWGEVGNQLAKMAKDEYENARRNREQYLREWDERDKNQKGSTPDLSKDKEDEFFSFGNSLRKDKYTGNPALDALREAKEKRLKKAKNAKLLLEEKEKLYAMAKEERRREYEAYPPPPYSKDLYRLPDSMYEELQLKRLLHGLYTVSDPEETRRKRQVYPTLPEEDYVYVQTMQLRKWIREEIRKSAEESSSSDDDEEGPVDTQTLVGKQNRQEETKPTKRPMQPLPTEREMGNSMWKEREVKAGFTSSTDSSEEESVIMGRKKKRGNPLRLRGGVRTAGTSADTSMDVDNEGYAGAVINDSVFTPGGQVVRKMTEISPEENTASDGSEGAFAGMGRKKRKIISDECKAGRSVAPGLRQDVAKEYGRRVRKLGFKLSEIVVTEATKKKISQATIKEITAVKEEYQELVDELILENALLLGRLWEARASEEVKEMELNQNRRAAKARAEPEPVEDVVVISDAETQGEISRNRKRKNALKARKQVRIEGREQRPVRQEMDVTTDGNTDGEYTEVRRRRKDNRARNVIDTTSGGETDVSVNPSKQKERRQIRIKKLKEVAPQKVFAIEVKDNNVESTRGTIWADIVKKTGAPKIARQTVVQKGETKTINIVAADDTTYQALKRITEERADVQLKPSKWPMVMIYDVDKTLTPSEISCNVLAQNTSMGNLLGEAATNVIRPLFKRGPREGETVWWVCEVRPDVHAKLISNGRVYIGLSNCRVAEYYDFQQCFTCLKYGHREAFCKEQTMTCTHCGVKGHKDTVCTKKNDPPKCANCGGNHVAHSKFCRERRKAIDNVVRRTDYKDPTCQA